LVPAGNDPRKPEPSSLLKLFNRRFLSSSRAGNWPRREPWVLGEGQRQEPAGRGPEGRPAYGPDKHPHGIVPLLPSAAASPAASRTTAKYATGAARANASRSSPEP
jgi:hypothetical protein